jgi:cytochrome c-type biogenesis protein
MLQYINDRLQGGGSEPLGLVFALILGIVSAATSACCTLPALGLIVGYSAMHTADSRKAVLKSALFFTLGILISLMILGAVSGFVGQIAQGVLGRYWKIFAGIVAVFLGLASLRLLPFNLSIGKADDWARDKQRRSGSLLAGFILGGIIAACSLPCNPGIFIVMGVAILQGAVLWAILLLGMFAVGFAMPLGAVMLGVSMGRVNLAAKGADATIRWIAGLVLIVIGFYFLITF